MLHQFKLNGYNIVLDTCSGAVHVVDDVAYDIIAEYESRSRDDIVRHMLEKYSDRADVTEEDVNACIDDITALKEDMNDTEKMKLKEILAVIGMK